jgi:hypothetical protein
MTPALPHAPTTALLTTPAPTTPAATTPAATTLAGSPGLLPTPSGQAPGVFPTPDASRRETPVTDRVDHLAVFDDSVELASDTDGGLIGAAIRNLIQSMTVVELGGQRPPHTQSGDARPTTVAASRRASRDWSHRHLSVGEQTAAEDLKLECRVARAANDTLRREREQAQSPRPRGSVVWRGNGPRQLRVFELVIRLGRWAEADRRAIIGAVAVDRRARWRSLVQA